MATQTSPAELLDVNGVAARLNVEPRFVRRLVAERRIRHFKIGKHLRFDAADVDELIAAGRRESAAGHLPAGDDHPGLRPLDQRGQLIMARHPGVTSLLRWFDAQHLPSEFRDIVDPASNLATEMISAISVDSPELTEGLRKLLEAKDCFVRAFIIAKEG